MLLRSLILAIALTGGVHGSGVRAQTPAQPAPSTSPTGRIAGRVIDGGTSKPLPSARVTVIGVVGTVATDLDGRFRTGPVPVGLHSIRVALIGFKPTLLDSIRVTDGQTAVVTVAISSAPVQLQELTVAADAPAKSSNAAGLLAAQQAAPAVTDGISAEAISKTPDSDAGQAMVRVTGLSVVDNKVVVRGLSERYSSSLLNGVEIASPEPDKKFVPLDAFNANLLESIVASKTATPDKPGDFAGGTVDIQTKEFPENGVLSFGVSQGWNSRSTFETFARGPRTFKDRLGFDGQHRGIIPSPGNPERFAESLRNVWTPKAELASPNTGLDFSIGGRKDLGGDALGYVLSLNYGAEREYNPDRLNGEGAGPIVFRDNFDRVDWSGIANLAYRIGAGHKIGFKNFYSRGTEELFRVGVGADAGDGPNLNYQGRFLQRYIAQSQFTGDHYLPGLFRSRLNWKVSYGQAGRNDLDNRQLRYFDAGSGYRLNPKQPSFRYNNSLRDKSYSGQGEWAIPFSFTSAQGGEFKIGGSYRKKDREFAAQSYELAVGSLPLDLWSLPPEQLLAPENLGPGGILYSGASNVLFPYQADERVEAAFGMVDMDLLRGLRFVGGLRAERWKARLTENENSRDYSKTDWLWSGNLTWIVSNQTNLRVAAYRTVARPDLRELSIGGYTEAVGGINVVGNPSLVPASIINGDVRFEIYPGPAELLAISGFYKRFDQPLVTTFVVAGDVVAKPQNLDRATSVGVELEARKSLGFIAKGIKNFSVGANVALIRSRVRYPDSLQVRTDPNLTFQGQSPYIINANANYATSGGGFSVAVLFNRFGQRIVRYGFPTSISGGNTPQNIAEKPRSTLDAKIRAKLWGGLSLSLAGKNLLDSKSVLEYDNQEPGVVPVPVSRIRSGISFSMGLSYAY